MALIKEQADNKLSTVLNENVAQISIVVPAYNEDGNLHQLYAELIKVLPSLNMLWEIIFVDDGSADKTWEEIEYLHQRDRTVKGIRFSRNFGHQYALYAGLSWAVGEVVVTMDADLQHPPNVIPELVAEWQQGKKIVHTIRLDPDNISLFKRVTSSLFYKIFSVFSGVQLDSGMADFRLLDRRVVEDLLQFREAGLFLRGLIQWVGYPSSTVVFQCQDRFSGVSKYTLKKMVKFALAGITSFSVIPLRISVFIGLITSLAAFAELFYVIFVRLYTATAVAGWASAVGIISFLFGVLFILLGVIGEYIGRILIEVRNRPRFLISEQLGVKRDVRKDFVQYQIFNWS